MNKSAFHILVLLVLSCAYSVFARELDTAWVRQISQFSSGQINEFRSIAVDSSGDIFCVGRTNALGLVVRMKHDGSVVWAKSIAVPDFNNFLIERSSSAISGKYYVIGHAGSLDGDPDWTICCIDTSGVLDWWRT